MKKRLMISTVFVIGFLGLMGCHKKEQEVSIVETSKEAEEVVESTENYNVDDSILVMDLPDNDTGIKNPQTEFKDMFGHSDDEKELPDDYLLTPYDYEGELREAFGEYWDAVMEYNQVSQLTQELSDRISEIGKKGWDFDHDGLRDWDEFHVYHTDPNKASTAGDLFSDSYKVNHEMDLFTYQEMDWIKADDRLSFKKTAGHPISNDTIYYAYEENYWDEEGLDLLDMSMEFGGEVKLTLTRDISNLEVEVFNTWDLTHTPIETIIDGNTLSFHVDLGYNYYLIHEKGYVIQTLSD